MDKIGFLLLLLLILCICVSPFYIPINKLKVHHASAKIEKISIKSPYGFSLVQVRTSHSFQTPKYPYLFIHGHKGSVKQAISMTKHFHMAGTEIDMFSIDFNEGAVALSHSLLLKEVEFAEKCIEEIHKRYPHQQITILAHSFGGVIAALALHNLSNNMVKGIIALSTPFVSSPITNDFRFIQEFNKMHEFLKNTTQFVISITGGIRDLTVPPQLTNTKELGRNMYHCYSTQIKGVHTEIDHVAMVWGEEFFDKLVGIIKICNTFTGSKAVREVKKNVQSEISKIVATVQGIDEVCVVVKENEIEGNVGIVLGGWNYYLIPMGSNGEMCLDGIEYRKTQKVLLGNLKSPSFFELLAGTFIDIPPEQAFATRIRLGSELSNPRFPIRIVISPGRTKAIHAKCGNEEIIKFHEGEFVIYFHEFCENGPEIWIFGSPDSISSVFLQIDPMGALICMVRDYRLHIFTSMFFLLLVRISEMGKYLQLLIFLSVYLWSGQVNSIFYWEDSGVNEEYSLLSLVFIVGAGRGLCALFYGICRIFEYFSRKLHINQYFLFGLIPIAWYFPWETSIILNLMKLKNQKLLEISLMYQFILLPQHIGHYIAVYTHGIYDSDYQILPAMVLCFSQLHFEKVEIKLECAISGFLIAFFGHGLLYRSVFILQLLCSWLSLKSFLNFLFTHLKKSLKH